MENSLLDSLELRKARLSDASNVGRLVRELAGEAADSAIRRRFRRLVIRPSYLVYVVLLKGQIVGLWIGREGYFLGADAPYLHLLGIVVDPDHQKQGLGTALVEKLMLDIYPKKAYCQVWTVTQHEHLHDFYERSGFEKTGARFVLRGRDAAKPPLGRRIVRKLGF